MTTRDERRQAKRELERLMPKARKLAAQAKIIARKTLSPIGEANAGVMRLENVVGVHIYQRVPWGWYADLLLDARKLPPGACDAIGTPENAPHPNRTEAEEFALMLLVGLINAEPEEVPDPPKQRPFCFFGHWLNIPVEAIIVAERASNLLGSAPPREHTVKRLQEINVSYFPNGVTPEAIQALSRSASIEFMVVIAMAYMNGIYAYPSDPPDFTQENTGSQAMRSFTKEQIYGDAAYDVPDWLREAVKTFNETK